MQSKFLKLSQFVFSGTIAVLFVFMVVLGLVIMAEKNKKEELGNLMTSGNSNLVAVRKASIKSGAAKQEISEQVIGGDARPVLIRKYLEHYGSPLAPYSDLIFELSQRNGIDYYWIVAIAQQESNLCKKIPENSFNCWGYGIHSEGTLRFPDYETALKSYAEYLKREYFDKGYTNADLIMTKYCPSSNGSWAYGVNHFINELTTGNF